MTLYDVLNEAFHAFHGMLVRDGSQGIIGLAYPDYTLQC